MDKEFGLAAVLAAGLVAVLAAFAAARWLPWALAVVAPTIAYFFGMHLTDLLDPQVGPLILHEAGSVYVAVSWVLPFLAIVALVAGLLLRRADRMQPPNNALLSDAYLALRASSRAAKRGR